jgi:hypothetical protein
MDAITKHALLQYDDIAKENRDLTLQLDEYAKKDRVKPPLIARHHTRNLFDTTPRQRSKS